MFRQGEAAVSGGRMTHLMNRSQLVPLKLLAYRKIYTD